MLKVSDINFPYLESTMATEKALLDPFFLRGRFNFKNSMTSSGVVLKFDPTIFSKACFEVLNCENAFKETTLEIFLKSRIEDKNSVLFCYIH